MCTSARAIHSFVFDLDLRRISVFEPEQHRFAYSFIIMEGAREAPIRLVGVAEEGALIVYTTPYSATTSKEKRFRVVKLLDREGYLKQDPVLKLPEDELLVTRIGTSGISVMPLPFGRESIIRLGPKDELYSGWNETIDITISALDETTPRSIQHQHQPVPVVKNDMDAILAAISSERRRQRIIDADLHETKPAYETFVVDDQGRVWVKVSMSGVSSTAQWLIFGSEGEVVGETVLPANVKLEVVKSGRAYGIEIDERGAQYVVTYKILD